MIALLQLDKKIDDSKLDKKIFDVRRLEVLHEEMDGKLDTIIEILSPSLERTTEHTEILDDHESRITKLERHSAAS
jgi:hypothetical protein